MAGLPWGTSFSSGSSGSFLNANSGDAAESSSQFLRMIPRFSSVSSGRAEVFAPVAGLSPAALGGGAYRFACPLGTNGFGLFRVEAQ